MARGGTIALDNGSTAVLVAERLAARDGTTIVTDNPAAAAAAWANGLTVVLLGVVVDPAIGGVIDAMAIDALRSTRCDVALLGACAIADGVGVVTEAASETAFKRALAVSAASVWVVATADKLGGAGAFTVAPLESLDVVVTGRFVVVVRRSRSPSSSHRSATTQAVRWLSMTVETWGRNA